MLCFFSLYFIKQLLNIKKINDEHTQLVINQTLCSESVI